MGRYGSVTLQSNARLTPINAKQFLQSLINNTKKRHSFEGELLCDLSVLVSSTWPSRPGIRPGELQVTRLCRRFSLSEEQAVTGCDGVRESLEHPDREPESLKPLIRCMQTIPCSTAECERGFRLHEVFLSQGSMSKHGWEVIALPHRLRGYRHRRSLSTNTFGKLCRLQAYTPF